ncbi:MAG: hypothetical protein AAF307_07120 [Pseudomonadota bacterium]
MNTALAILSHALRMLIYDVSATFRVLLPAVLMVLGAVLAINVFAPEVAGLLSQQMAETALTENPAQLYRFALFGLIAVLGYALMAVLWHRHVLLSDADAHIRPDARTFMTYLARAVAVSFLQFLAAIPLFLVIAAVDVSMNASGDSNFSFAGTAGTFVLIWVALRLSVILPAAAIGETMSIRDSWVMTGTRPLELLGLAALLTGLNMLIYAFSGLLIPDAGAVASLLSTIVFMAEALIFVSVLTTLYGVLVEGRSLGQ